MDLTDLKSAIGRLLAAADASAPGFGSVDITPSDTTVFNPPLRSLRCTGSGNVAFVGLDGVSAVWAVTNFDMIPVMMTKVLATGTTATGLRGVR